ncbi:MAG: isoleucine--tRNA ligase [Bacteroidales bacterium]|jgi:isoleucyl-tRNA synthetase|nr:isoleucine--tRNA ligase [Bacteroidales bacterium]
MDKKYKEYQRLNLTQLAEDILQKWQKENTFLQSMSLREGKPDFVFYEGPPSANGQPGIHHVMARAIKDIFCRYKTQKGFYVKRKAGWDTHGLPVELGVEKNLGITKEDIGKKISVEEYNNACRAEVMKYKDMWDDLTVKMGYWVDLSHPYITFKNEYIETLWYLLSIIYKKGWLYKGYTIQPYSPAAGTGLSSHELNMPGCYRDVKDTTCVAQFKVRTDQKFPCPWGFEENDDYIPDNLYFLAWTTTPWTLPSNTALAVGNNIDYLLVKTFNPYSGKPILVILAKALLDVYFPQKNADLKFEDYKAGDKEIPFAVIAQTKGEKLVGLKYEQLIPWVSPQNPPQRDLKKEYAFRIIAGDFVTTEDGTGIVHIAPTFGSDDDRVAKQNGIVPLFLLDKNEKQVPMVDLTGKFFNICDLDRNFVEKYVNVDLYSEYAGRFVKNAYDPKLTDKDPTLDVDLCVMLKMQDKVFKIEKHTHNYPHCWRTDKPVLYYPLDSWFIRTTAVKERMIELNKTITWKPEATGSGRFGNWLENLVDWNLSRSRYWGTPLPIWRTEDGDEEICIGSVEELKNEINKSIEAGFMNVNTYQSSNYEDFDLHRPFIDNVILVSPSGKKMYRETDLIDVWFDSGAMPYAQYFYPKNDITRSFPADFIAEGVDQTRGWFFTLHAIATMISDSVSYKAVISNGLVLDKNGNKMSKRLGNAVDPFQTIAQFGPDATRWYMITNAQPWDNLKFDTDGIDEVRRKFFGTLYNTYGFFALYANIDGFTYKEAEIDIQKRPEIDRWILSELNTLTQEVDSAYSEYEPTRAGRAIQVFVDECLSNWYVRLCRRRFWKGDYSEDKISAYQTLYKCLETLCQLMAPIAPFFAERMFCDLNAVSERYNVNSVHLTDFPMSDNSLINKELEERMSLARQISSMVLSLRKRHNLRVRQPLSRIMLPVRDQHFVAQIEAVKNLILSEVNVKQIDFLTDTNNILVKTIKPDFKKLGPKYGKIMKSVAAKIAQFSQQNIAQLESQNCILINVENQEIEIQLSDVEIFTQDIPGWVVANEGLITVALDVNITPELKEEGLARELVNRIQNIRKDSQLDVQDKICIQVKSHPQTDSAFANFKNYICNETLAESFEIVKNISTSNLQIVDLVDDIKAEVMIEKK